MGEYRLLLMFILSVVIPDVIERFKPVTGIRMILLHHLISHSTHLECIDFNNSKTISVLTLLLNVQTRWSVRDSRWMSWSTPLRELSEYLEPTAALRAMS